MTFAESTVNMVTPNGDGSEAVTALDPEGRVSATSGQGS
jgi:hypothetical protein